MVNNDKKIQLVIVSGQFLYRLGIKTMLSFIDIEPDLVELDSLDNLKSFLLKATNSNFVIISDDVITYPNQKCINHLKQIHTNSKFMVVGGEINKFDADICQILSSDSQKELLDKFHDFFFESGSRNFETGSAMLSEREIDVLKAVALGLSNKEIAEKLFISINTVVTHRKNITEKLGIKTIAGLTVYALMNNFISPEEVNK